MLVLSRKAGQRIAISENVVISVLQIQGNRVQIGIEAPAEMVIRRSELSAWDGPNMVKSTVVSNPICLVRPIPIMG